MPKSKLPSHELNAAALAKLEEAMDAMNKKIIPVHCIDCIHYHSETSALHPDFILSWCDEGVYSTLPKTFNPDEHTFYCAYGKMKGD